MFYGASSSVFEKAKHLRNNMTVTEQLLWTRLSNNQLNGFRFRRQHPIYCYIADFYCHEAKLVIELDGSIHNLPDNKEYDIYRDDLIKDFGIKIIRFKNEEVFENMDGVVQTIIEALPAK